MLAMTRDLGTSYKTSIRPGAQDQGSDRLGSAADRDRRRG